MSRCLLGVIDDLQEEKLTTGNILKKYKIETLREIKSISIKKSTPMLKELFKTDEDMLTREYVILQHGKIKIWTKEAYPLCHFKD